MPELDDNSQRLRRADSFVMCRVLEAPIQGRHREFEAIPAAIKDMNQAIDAARLFYTSALRENVPRPKKRAEAEEDGEITSSAEEPASTPSFTHEELEEVNGAIDEAQKWLKEKIEQVAGSPKNVDVPFRAAEIDQKGIQLQKKVMRLVSRLKHQPKKSTTTKSSESSGTATPRSTPAEETGIPNKRDEL